jgi:hypothetical protein
MPTGSCLLALPTLFPAPSLMEPAALPHFPIADSNAAGATGKPLTFPFQEARQVWHDLSRF